MYYSNPKIIPQWKTLKLLEPVTLDWISCHFQMSIREPGRQKLQMTA